MGSFMKKCSAVFITMLVLIAMAPVCAFATEKYDINGNGVVNIVDAQIAYDISCGRLTDLSNYSDLQKAADVNGDGVVDASDALAIQRYALTGTTEEPVEKAPLTLDSYTVKGTTITASFTYTNMKSSDSCAMYDYNFKAHQDGYLLSYGSYGGDYSTEVMPGYQTKFTYSWPMKTEGDVSVSVTAEYSSNGKSIEQVLTVSGTSAEKPTSIAPLTLDSYTVKGTTITASFTYTNMRDEASYAALDYDFDAYQDGYVLSSSSSGGDYFTRVLPGYQTKFTYSWTMKTEGDVTVKVTAHDWGKGKSIEQVLTVSGTSAQDLTSTEATAS